MSLDIYVRIKDFILIDKLQDVAKKNKVSVDVLVSRILTQCNELKLIDKAMGPIGISDEDGTRR